MKDIDLPLSVKNFIGPVGTALVTACLSVSALRLFPVR